MSRPDILVHVKESPLSDGSKVYAVVLTGWDMTGSLVIDAVSEMHATDLAEKIASAINTHSNMQAVTL